MRESHAEFQKYVFLTASWGFIYSISFYKDANCALKFSRIIFGIIIIINILSYFFSSLANEYQLKHYDSKETKLKEHYQEKTDQYNNYIEYITLSSVYLIISGIVLFAIFFLVE
jgi:TRAP-type C4-dicarboxylate transport system permease small subunit